MMYHCKICGQLLENCIANEERLKYMIDIDDIFKLIIHMQKQINYLEDLIYDER